MAGVGFGADIGLQAGPGSSMENGVSLNLAGSVGGAVPVAPGVNVGGSYTRNFIGTDVGDYGLALGRAGTPSGYVNAGMNAGIATPELYDLDCE